MSTKTKSSIAAVIASAEAGLDARADEINAELSDLIPKMVAAQQKAEDVRDEVGALHEVKARLKRGEAVDPMDWLAAEASDAIAEYQAKALVSRVNALRQTLPPAHALLAEAVEPVVRAVLPGIEVLTTRADARSWRTRVEAGTVAVVLVQDKNIDTDPSLSTLSGKVHVHFIRNPLVRPLPIKAFEDTARALRVPVTVRRNVIEDEHVWQTVAGVEGSGWKPDDVVIDTVTLTVTGVLDGLPRIARTDNSAGLNKHLVSQVLGGRVGDGYLSEGGLVHDIDTARLDEGTAFHLNLGASSVIAAQHKQTETINDGVRTVRIVQVLNVSGMDAGEFAVALREEAAGYVGGAVHPGLGLVESFEVLAREPRGGFAMRPTVPIEVTSVYLSQVT
jgi:hypothetical protein